MSTIRLTNLKPCPFCGGKAMLNSLYSDFHQVSCSNPLCKVLPQTWCYDTLEEAIEAWNWRYTDEQT